MKLFIIFLVYFFCAVPNFLFAQSQNIWYFGNMAGLDFNVNPPAPISSSLNALEGTATTCSNDGMLLFYSNGATVWDRFDQVMPNGSALAGGASSAQAALIVPLPGSCNFYYLFTTEDHESDGGVSYSIIDMCLNAGLGDVVSGQKNILLENRTAENLTAVRHANGEDVWILAHKLGSNEFLVYLLTAGGLNTTPIISAIGSSYPLDAHIGRIKASHASDKIVSVASFKNIYEMFDFNNATGIVSNWLDLKPILGSGRFVYGIEFSPNDSLLYLSTFFVSSDLIQLDLTTLQQINLRSIAGNYHFGALQLAPDGKIYLARQNQTFVDVIHLPDTPGVGCNYDPGGQALAPGTTCQLGFPNIIPYSLMPISAFPDLLPGDTLICANDSLEISLPALSFCNASYLWEDGTTSAERSIYTPGLYQVTLISSCGNFSDSMLVSQTPDLIVSIPDDTLCSGDTVFAITQMPDVDYLWSDNTSDTFFQPIVSGLHWLRVSNECASFTDSFYVTIIAAPLVDFPDTALCQGDTIQLSVPDIDQDILWSNGESDAMIQITEGGLYWVSLSNTCGSVTDTFTTGEIEKPSIQLSDTVICDGDTVLITTQFPDVHYLWSDNTSNPFFQPSFSGLHWLQVSNECASFTDSFYVTLIAAPVVDFADSVICQGETIQLSVPDIDQDILWSNGELDDTIRITAGGQYWVNLSNECGSVVDTFTIGEIEKPSIQLSDTVICEGDVVLNAFNPGSEYLWSDLSVGDVLIVSDPGVYWVVVTNHCGSDSSSMTLTVRNCNFLVFVPNVFSPNGDGLNDFIQPSLSMDVISYEFMIFDRWGNNVFLSTDPSESWDGRFREKNCITGVYTMILTCTSVDGFEEKLKGDITLLR